MFKPEPVAAQPEPVAAEPEPVAVEPESEAESVTSSFLSDETDDDGSDIE